MQEFDNGLEKKWDYDMNSPVDSEVSIEKLKNFLEPEDSLIFYGGEPLVKMNKIVEIMDNLDCKFQIQTNGMLLNKIPEKYLMKLDKMLVSIDGTKQRTDSQKGVGTYERILKNVREIRDKGYSGEIVARMVITEGDIYEQVKHILDLGIFDSIHWQIDAGFYKNDFNFEKFSKFVEEYNKSISKLLDYWVKEIKKGKVLKLYPFLGIFDIIYYGKKSRLPCGSGYANFTITTSGKLSACPIMNSVKNFYCGSLESGIEREIHIHDEKCEKCRVFDICGGRCLYWREAKLWPPEGDDLICKTIIHLIDEIRNRVEEIKGLIDSGVVSEKDFEFEKYFGPEIIP
jgi:putative peptide-modifying radical SAM enzyme